MLQVSGETSYDSDNACECKEYSLQCNAVSKLTSLRRSGMQLIKAQLGYRAVKGRTVGSHNSEKHTDDSSS